LDKAEKAFAEAVRLAPNEADHHFYLGWTRLRRKQPAQAAPELQQALKLKNDHYLAIYFLGDVYLQQDNYQEAMRWYQRAAALDAADPDPHIQLGICYALLKRRTDAIAAVRQALAIDPNNQRAREILGKI
jgi:tetratricopeptide (TPR) repeat protein